VHAHPDDESSQTGGTLAAYSAAGWRTILITCTDGAQGDGVARSKPGQAEHDPKQVAERRSGELDMAAVALGIHEVIKLGFPDSGVPTESVVPARKVFSRRPLQPMVDRLTALIELHRPDVVVTYPPNGLSGHPDHIRTHTLVRAALRAEAKDRMAAGAVNGKTSMTLKELGANETELLVETDVNILGKIGEFGQPIIRKKADAMLKEFVENIKKQLTGK